MILHGWDLSGYIQSDVRIHIKWWVVFDNLCVCIFCSKFGHTEMTKLLYYGGVHV